MGPQIMLSMVMHRDLPLAKIGCSKLNLIDVLTRLCLPVLRMCPYLRLKMKQHRHTLSGERGEMYFFKKRKIVLARPILTYCWLIKESTVSISLEIYRFLPAFSFFLVHLFVAQFNWCSENAVLTVSIDATVLHYGPKANAQLVHSMDATMDWNEKYLFFCDQKCCLYASKGMAFLGPGY